MNTSALCLVQFRSDQKVYRISQNKIALKVFLSVVNKHSAASSFCGLRGDEGGQIRQILFSHGVWEPKQGAERCWRDSLSVSLSEQCGQPPPAQPDDRRQPGRGLWPNSAPPTGGDGCSHHGHQVSEHCSRDPHRASWEGVCVCACSNSSIRGWGLKESRGIVEGIDFCVIAQLKQKLTHVIIYMWMSAWRTCI